MLSPWKLAPLRPYKQVNPAMDKNLRGCEQPDQVGAAASSRGGAGRPPAGRASVIRRPFGRLGVA